MVECRSTVPKVVGSSPIAVIFPYSIVGKIPACHAGVPGSIPGEGASFFAIFFLVECSLSFVLSFGVGFVGIAHLVAEIWPFQNCTSFFFWDGRRGGGEGG